LSRLGPDDIRQGDGALELIVHEDVDDSLPLFGELIYAGIIQGDVMFFEVTGTDDLDLLLAHIVLGAWHS
jgi:hypothetical protein